MTSAPIKLYALDPDAMPAESPRPAYAFLAAPGYRFAGALWCPRGTRLEACGQALSVPLAHTGGTLRLSPGEALREARAGTGGLWWEGVAR